ncbi:hypothetical protein FJV76_03450 [Mesorhizobium sp. WSM4303]|uniref:hypothetical protein n=1 Tax=unclassified Mesorhizobium TaxID=325217 RepID=UPI00115EE3DA|nr:MULTISPECIES: hypothetical protein [unclassified Mesorhizobium]TRC93667.1 hypothetical protein FJV77_21230 [Mesorhizobium sp. WSM4306]TRD08584.1 hypothetical protein FJV76_03450 [Mesorhizobium sp. WSM4303]
MTLADLSCHLFTIFNGLRVVSYLPQIVRVAQDKHGATAISYATWLLWTAANATTGLYAHINLNDPALAAINWLNAACCASHSPHTNVIAHALGLRSPQPGRIDRNDGRQCLLKVSAAEPDCAFATMFRHARCHATARLRRSR